MTTGGKVDKNEFSTAGSSYPQSCTRGCPPRKLGVYPEIHRPYYCYYFNI